MVSTDSTKSTGVDESPIVVTKIVVDGRCLVAREPLRFEVTFENDDEGPWYELAGPFEIVLGASSPTELRDLLGEELEFLWHVYAEAEPSTLSPGAQRLGEALRGCLIPADRAS